MLVAMFKITHSKPIPRRLRARFVVLFYLFIYFIFCFRGEGAIPE